MKRTRELDALRLAASLARELVRKPGPNGRSGISLDTELAARLSNALDEAERARDAETEVG